MKARKVQSDETHRTQLATHGMDPLIDHTLPSMKANRERGREREREREREKQNEKMRGRETKDTLQIRAVILSVRVCRLGGQGDTNIVVVPVISL